MSRFRPFAPRLTRLLLVATVLAAPVGAPAELVGSEPAGSRRAPIGRTVPGTLENYLAGRLFVARPEDTAFVEKVAALVRRGDLPESMVRGTCEWAAVRAIRRGASCPFPYFRTALSAKARRLGVSL